LIALDIEVRFIQDSYQLIKEALVIVAFFIRHVRVQAILRRCKSKVAVLCDYTRTLGCCLSSGLLVNP
jgi:hypothetical protein